MIVTFFRSSSYNTWDFCQHKYMIDYFLGWHSPANKAAEKGTVTHKALELLARYKLATQEKRTIFSDDELGEYLVSTMTPDKAIQEAWNYYTTSESVYEWEEADFKECRKWMYDVLNWRDGMFSPLKREIVMPEQYFEFIIEEPWAAYDYELPTGERISGYLGIKGTIDLIVKAGNNLEMLDWKTGARKDWAMNSFNNYKSYEKLMEDPQLRLYHYAATRLFPNTDNIFVTIFYIKDGGPESLCFTDKDIEMTKKMLEKRFNVIRNTVRPSLIYPNRKCGWCWFSKNKFIGDTQETEPTENYEESVCKTLNREVIKLGIDRVMTKYAKPNAWESYGSGGGRRNSIPKGDINADTI